MWATGYEVEVRLRRRRAWVEGEGYWDGSCSRATLSGPDACARVDFNLPNRASDNRLSIAVGSHWFPNVLWRSSVLLREFDCLAQSDVASVYSRFSSQSHIIVSSIVRSRWSNSRCSFFEAAEIDGPQIAPNTLSSKTPANLSVPGLFTHHSTLFPLLLSPQPPASPTTSSSRSPVPSLIGLPLRSAMIHPRVH
jgi:hypothetical protein